MSGGTSSGNIVTEAVATYGVRTWLTTAKADAFGVISDAQLESIIGANWFNNVDDNLKQVNAWFNGTGEAAHIMAAEATIGALTFDSTPSLMVGSGALTDAPTTADDVVIGNLGGTDRGVSILSTSVGRLVFVDTAATLTGYVAYTHATDTLSLGVGGATEVNLTATTLAPHANGGLALGTSSLRYSAAHVTDATAYSTLTVGDGTGSPSGTINRDTAGTGDLIFAVEGVTKWRWRHAADDSLLLGRFSGGVLQDSITFNESGGITTPSDLFVLGSAEISGDLQVGGLTANALELSSGLTITSSTASATLGNGLGAVELDLNGSTSTVKFRSTSVLRYEATCNGTTFAVKRYSGGVYADAITYDSNGVVMPSVVVVGDDASSLSVLGVAKDNAGSARMAFFSEGTARWYWSFDSSEDLNLVRLDSGGNIQSTCTFSNSTGAWSLPNDLSLTGASRTLTLGDNSGAATFVISKTTGTSGAINFLSNATKRWALRNDTSQNLLFERFNSSAVLQDTTTVSNGDGSWSFPAGIGVSGQTRRLTSGSGAPSASATNGDIYWRIDGTISTTFYVRIGGVWTAAVWT